MPGHARHSIPGARRALPTIPGARRALPTLPGRAVLLTAAVLIMLAGCSTEKTNGGADTRESSAMNQNSLQESARQSPALQGRKSAEDRPGRWRVAMGDGGRLSGEQLAEIERLESIGYLSGSKTATGVGGVTVHDRTRAGHGYNFFTSGHFPGALLMDMDGNILHEWRCAFLDAFPECVDIVLDERTQHWRRSYLYENGDVLGIFEGVGLVKLDRDSNIIWTYDGGAHHDLEVMDDGRIFVLTRDAHRVPRLKLGSVVLEDFITILSSNGEELDRISILSAFWDSNYDRALLALKMRRSGDITHTNTIEVLDGSLADRLPAFRKANVLISFRKLHAIAVVDIEARKVVWLMAGPWIGQHQPTVLPNDHILVFDNGGETDISRVIEFDPVTQEEVWRYGGSHDDGFYTKSCGTSALLPNGNILITESDNGRAFEVTRGREIVWEYRNPARAGSRSQLIATIFEMVRLPESFPVGWAEH